jgi:hypothetical protein
MTTRPSASSWVTSKMLMSLLLLNTGTNMLATVTLLGWTHLKCSSNHITPARAQQ